MKYNLAVIRLSTLMAALVLTLTAFLIFPAGDVLAQEGSAPTAFVNAWHLNVRSGPGVNYSIINTIDRNTEVAVTGRNVDASWVHIILPSGSAGWVNARYLASNLKPFTFLPLEEPVSSWPDRQPTAFVNAWRLNVRSGPGVAYDVVAVTSRNTEVPVTHRNWDASWVRIVLPDGEQGWVNARYLASNLKPFTFLPVGL